jgi:hypothetical protein
MQGFHRVSFLPVQCGRKINMPMKALNTGWDDAENSPIRHG